MTPTRDAPSVAEGYRALADGRAGVAGSADVVWVEGPDASSFLQGLLTQDVAALRPGGADQALLLDAKGRIRASMRVHRDGPDGFTLLTPPGRGAALLDALTGYHFSENLELLGPEPVTLLTLAGVDRDAAAELGDLVMDGQVPGTLDLLTEDPEGALIALDAMGAPAESLEIRRIEAGVPEIGRDTAETTLVQEAGLEGATVSFDKGCYLGQETVARVAHRGGVRRLLRGLLLERTVPPGTPVLYEGREVGRATSVAVSPQRGPVALAILRREAEPGTSVRAGTTDASVVEVPFPDA